MINIKSNTKEDCKDEFIKTVKFGKYQIILE